MDSREDIIHIPLPSTSNEYLRLNQQNEILFQNNEKRNETEQRLFDEWQNAVSGWRNADNAWQIANNQIDQLKNMVNILQKQVNDLTDNIMAGNLSTATTAKNIKTNAPQSATPIPSINIEVEYNTDEDDLAKETEWIRVKHNAKKRKRNITPSPPSPEKAKRVNASETPKKERLPPPIIVENVKSYEDLYEKMVKQVPESAFQVKFTNDTTAKINSVNSETYRGIINVLEDNYNYHTYENKQTRPIRVMVKNLHQSCKPENIKKYLLDHGFKIITADNKWSYKDKTPLNIFRLTFDNSEDIEKIYNIKHILGCRVEIQRIKGSALVPQCKNCQAYGHTKKFCSKEPRCVKCAGRHLTMECQKEKNQNPKCVNCGAEHPANYRGCIVAKEIQSIRNKHRVTSNPVRNITEKKVEFQQKEKSNSENSNKNPTYASTVALGLNNQKTQKSESIDISQTLQLILTKITNLEGSFISINERVRKLESSVKETAPKPKKK